MEQPQPTGMKIVKLLSGKPQLCQHCAGWGYVGGPTDSERGTCPTCKGQRTLRLAEVRGIIMVPVDTKEGMQL